MKVRPPRRPGCERIGRSHQHRTMTGGVIAVARRIDPGRAYEAMLARGAKPLEPFVDTSTRWRCLCLGCDEVILPRYNDVVNKGSGACKGRCRSEKIAAA